MAPPTQVRGRDLKPGDIMLQLHQGNVTGKLIAFGQAITGLKNSELVHAAIMFDSRYLFETIVGGIVASDIHMGALRCSYQVYRSTKPDLGTIAANLANVLYDVHGANKHNVHYSLDGAVKSIGGAKPAKSSAELDRVLDKLFEGKTSKFFCSQFVVLTYQTAGGQIGMSPRSVIPLDDARVSPARLSMLLTQSPHFEHIGYMLPNQR